LATWALPCWSHRCPFGWWKVGRQLPLNVAPHSW
jgi:hypothetical protein